MVSSLEISYHPLLAISSVEPAQSREQVKEMTVLVEKPEPEQGPGPMVVVVMMAMMILAV